MSTVHRLRAQPDILAQGDCPLARGVKRQPNTSREAQPQNIKKSCRSNGWDQHVKPHTERGAKMACNSGD